MVIHRALPHAPAGLRHRLAAAAHELPLRHRSLRWAVLALGVAASAWGAWVYDSKIEREARLRLEVIALDKANDIELRLRAYADVLYAMRGLFDASREVTREDFRRFAGALSLGERYPGLTNISYSFRVAGKDKAAFERAIRAELRARGPEAPPFAVKPPGERPEYAVLTYIEPMGKNIAAWGLDLNADPKRRAAVDGARDSGAVSSSAGVTLVRDSGSQITSILMRLAVYGGGGVPASLDQRRARYRGLVGSTVRVDELIEATVTKEALASTRLRVRLDGGGAAESAVLYDSLAPGARDGARRHESYASSHRIAAGDRDWIIELTPLSDPVARLDRAGVGAVLVVMLAASALLFWLMTSVATILRLRDALVDQATHDPLTGLYNRRYMEEWLRLELHRARRHGRAVGVVMLDIDHFKRVNDRFGHEAGDLVLREVADTICAAARKSDVICRYGGEEFLVLMPEASLADAARKAEELRAAVGRLRLQSRGTPVGALAISAGVCAFPDHGQDAEALLRCADEALYAAKERGRDRVVLAEGRPAYARSAASEPALAGT